MRTRSLMVWVATTALTLGSMTLLPVGSAQAADCSPIIITASGSNQSFQVGKEMSAVINAVKNRAAAAGVAVKDAPVLYPAVSWSNYLNVFAARFDGLDQSEGLGRDVMYTAVNLAFNSCPRRAVMLAGYSQGAEVVLRTIAKLPATQRATISVGLLGNPSFRGSPGDSSNWGSYDAKLNGIRPSVIRQVLPVDPSVRKRTIDACAAGDPLCNFKPSAGISAIYGLISGTSPHLKYVGAYTTRVGEQLWSYASAFVPTTAPPSGGGGGTPAPQTWTEQSGSYGSPTFTNPYNASGPGTRVPAMSYVQVTCRVYAPAIASANPDGWWYRISSSPWNNAYYAVANTFWNGDVPGQKPYMHNTDFGVPVC